jgi:hypothetical protein
MMLFLAVLALIAIAVTAYLRFNTVKYRRFQSICDTAFEQVYSQFHPKPSLEKSNSYGFPQFTVMFDSKSTCEKGEAEGLNAVFKDRIAEICFGKGTPEHPFRVDAALSFGYPGHIQDRIAALKVTKNVIHNAPDGQ